MSVEVGNSVFKPLPSTPGAKITGVHDSLIQECEKDILWYRDHFLGKPHLNYLALDSQRGPLAISLIHDQTDQTFKILLRSTQGSERFQVTTKSISWPWYRKFLGLGPPPENIFQSISYNIPTSSLKFIKDTINLPGELLQMEERQVIRSYKFGLGYLRAGQTTEGEMFANASESMSEQYNNFLSYLGETIELKGWRGYRAGLDVQNGQTGTHSVYTKWQGYEIMFHVATMLPYNERDKQQLERKRHIGNDIVIIIFQDSNTPLQLSSITSHQNHIVVVVQPNGNDEYKFVVAARDGTGSYHPDIPDPSVLSKNATSRDYFFSQIGKRRKREL